MCCARTVPCLRRVSQLNYGAGKDDEGDLMMSFGAEGDGKDGDDEWVATHSSAEGTSRLHSHKVVTFAHAILLQAAKARALRKRLATFPTWKRTMRRWTR